MKRKNISGAISTLPGRKLTQKSNLVDNGVGLATKSHLTRATSLRQNMSKAHWSQVQIQRYFVDLFCRKNLNDWKF